MSATAQITEALDLDEKLANFNNGFADWLKSTIDSQVQILRESSGLFDWIGKVLFKSGDYFDASHSKLLQDRVTSGKATDAEKSELEALRKEKRENDYADQIED